MSDATSKIPELQFDLLGRVIPGAVTLALYFGHHENLFSSIGNVALGLIAAYVVGFTLQMIAVPLICYLILDRLCRRLRPKNKGWPLDTGAMWAFRAKQTGEKGDMILKRLGERNMFLTLFLMSVAAIFLPPQLLRETPWIMGIAAVGFGNGFYWSSVFISREVDAENRKQELNT